MIPVLPSSPRYHSATRTWLYALFLSVALCAGTAFQLMTEFFGLEGEWASGITPRHLVLGFLLLIFAACSLFAAVAILRRAHNREARRAYRADFARFNRSSAVQMCVGAIALQVVIAILVQVTEPGFRSWHDVLIWIVATLIGALVGTLAACYLVRRLPELAVAIAALFVAVSTVQPTWCSSPERPRPRLMNELWSFCTFKRPPPLHS